MSEISLTPEQLKELLKDAVSQAVSEVMAAQPQQVPVVPTEEKGTPIEMQSLEGLDPNSPQYKMLAMAHRYPPVIEKQKSLSQQQAVAEREQMQAMLAARKEAALRGKLPDTFGGRKPQASGATVELGLNAGKDYNESAGRPLTPQEIKAATAQVPPSTPEMNRYQAAMQTKFKGQKKA